MATNYTSKSCLPITVHDFGCKDDQIKECRCLVTLLLEKHNLKLCALLMYNHYWYITEDNILTYSVNLYFVHINFIKRKD